MMINMSNAPTLKLIRQIGAESETDPRTVSRVLAGQRARPICRERIVAALSARGLRLEDFPKTTDTTTKGPPP